MDNKTNKNNTLIYLYSSIKNDDLESYKKYNTKISQIFSNLKFKNLALYSFEKGASNICNFLFNSSNYQNTLNYIYEQSQFQNGFLNQILSKNNEKILFFYKNYIQYKDKQIDFDKNIDKIFYTSLTKLNENNFNIFYDIFEQDLESFDFSNVDIESILSIIVNFNNTSHIKIINLLDKGNYLENISEDKKLNLYLTSIKHCNLLLIRKLESILIEKDLVNEFHDDLLSISALNPNNNVFEYYFNKYLKSDNTIPENISPIHFIFENKDDYKCLFFLTNTENSISNGLFSISKHLKQDDYKKFIFNILPYLKKSHMKCFIENIEHSSTFWNSVFLNFNTEEIKKLTSNEFFLESYLNLAKYPEKSHLLFNSTIIGKKDFFNKIDFLLKDHSIINSDNSNNFFKGKIISNDLFFIEKNNNFSKPIKSFSFVSTLSSLPFSQMRSILNNTSIKTKLNNSDYFTLYIMSLQKKNGALSLNKEIKSYLKKDLIISDKDRNLNDYLQYLLINLQDDNSTSIFNIMYRNKYSEIISKFEEVPNNLLSKIALNMVQSSSDLSKDISYMNSVLHFNQYLMQSFNNSIISFLLQKERDDFPDNILKIFKNNRNTISKVCFAKLINLNIVENYSDSNLINFLSLPFVDYNADSVLSNIDYINDEDSIYNNIDTFYSVKDNQIFDIFLQHQKDNLKSKHYPSKIIQSYNLKMWSMLFSIIDSGNKNQDQFINKILEVTNFEMPIYHNKSNLSINNFNKISHHFVLPKSFWEKFLDFYSDKDDVFRLSASVLYINYYLKSNVDLNFITPNVLEQKLNELLETGFLNKKDFTSMFKLGVEKNPKFFNFYLQFVEDDAVIDYLHEKIDNNKVFDFSHLNNFLSCIKDFSKLQIFKFLNLSFFKEEMFISTLGQSNQKVFYDYLNKAIHNHPSLLLQLITDINNKITNVSEPDERSVRYYQLFLSNILQHSQLFNLLDSINEKELESFVFPNISNEMLLQNLIIQVLNNKDKDFLSRISYNNFERVKLLKNNEIKNIIREYELNQIIDSKTTVLINKPKI